MRRQSGALQCSAVKKGKKEGRVGRKRWGKKRKGGGCKREQVERRRKKALVVFRIPTVSYLAFATVEVELVVLLRA